MTISEKLLVPIQQNSYLYKMDFNHPNNRWMDFHSLDKAIYPTNRVVIALSIQCYVNTVTKLHSTQTWECNNADVYLRVK